MRHVSDLHIHTLVSHHAYSTVLENAQQAHAQGLGLIAITDHCYGAPDSGNTWHFGNTTIWPREMAGVFVLRGIEANIMSMDGTVDASQRDMDAVDYVIASLHPYCIAPESKQQHMRALFNALENPSIHTIGHPADAKFDLDMKQLAKACAQANKHLEINEHAMARHPFLEQLNIELLEACAHYGTKIVLASDAHICFEVGRFSRIDALLEKVDFPEALIWNSDIQRVLVDLKVDPSP